MIDAFHSNWSKPFFVINPGEEYYIEDFEILTTILSALKWRENNGRIKMITDEVAASYYRKLGIEKIWDLGIDISLNDISNDINPNIFWAAGKIFSLNKVKSPIVMIDTDFIVWENLSKYLKDEKIAVIHREDINEEVYPSSDYFRFKDSYKLNKSFSWDVLPCNTALIYINDEYFKDYYVNTSISFMNNVITNNDRIKFMVFAEQRLISMCAEDKKINIKELSNLKELYNNQKIYTHVWGYKDMMRKDYYKRKEFCIKCIKRIIKDFPEYEEMIVNIKELNEYIKLVYSK